jgi:hypothetical protein
MRIIEVTDNVTRKQFHRVPHLIYKNDPNWVCQLEPMVDEIFNPAKNKAFRHGKAIRWILVDEKNNAIGRIGAFINYHLANTYEQPTGGCGFFECIDNQEAANLLFQTAAEWNKTNGMKAMDGPINFGENYINWGLLADGFMRQGFGMPYNPPYYVHLFENYGFQVYFKQYSYHLDITMPELPDRFWKVAEWVSKKPQYSFRHFLWNEAEKFIDDFCVVYDNAWRFHEHYKPIDKDDLRDFLKNSKILIDEEFIWFAYHEDEPIALFVMVPDLNQILVHLNGKLDLFSILKLLWLKRRKTMTRTRSLIIGISPKYQKSGIESAIFYNLRPVLYRKPWYKEMELSWAGDFNPKIVALYESVGGKRMKTHYTMRYLFDRSVPFKRAPIIGMEKQPEETKN